MVTITKSIPPYMPFEGGFGSLGVVIMDASTKKLQCHICGKFVWHIIPHSWNAHKVRSVEYKEMTGLNRSAVLVSPAVREKMSASWQQNPERYEQMEDARSRISGGRGPQVGTADKRTQFRNRYGTCDAQLRARFHALAEQLGRTPTYAECPFAGVMLNRFGTWNEAVVAMGYEPRQWTRDNTQ